jgi:rare lipoprotein A
VNGIEVGRQRIATDVIEHATPETRVSGPYSMNDGTTAEPGTGATSQSGQATWYDPPWSGLTAAHPWLPFGTYVRVRDVDSGRSVTVVVDDRGPFSPGRIIDLSPEAFERLAPLGRGVLDVELAW